MVAVSLKNSYDADADWVKLYFVGFSPNGAVLKDSKIVIEDNGVGMSKDIIQNEIGRASCRERV